MTSGGFGAHVPALATAASAFESQADPILTQAERLELIKGSASSTGSAYAAQGDAYHQALTGPLQSIIRGFGEKCIWVSTTLTDTGLAYTASDGCGSIGLSSAGSGLASG